ncbi:MAG: alginate lyase family protein [Gammaproteobacteria bacterium]
MNSRRSLMMATMVACCAAVLCVIGTLARADLGSPGSIFFDVDTRRAQLATPAYAAVRASCLALTFEKSAALDPPLAGLNATDGYGSDDRAQPFAWAMMVLSGRALAGDLVAETTLRHILSAWATAQALTATEETHDAYYALKRTLLPTMLAYAIVRGHLDDAERVSIERWLDDLVRRVDKRFDGDVDHNNHRYLADSVLMAWGALIGDGKLYDSGLQRYREALAQARPDGSLPLEVRRGARASWYMRQSLASLVTMAEIAAHQGDDLYGLNVNGVSLRQLLGFFLNSVALPDFARRYAAENYIPGPNPDYRQPDFGFLQRRPHGRHYLAWAEAYLGHDSESVAGERLRSLLARTALPQRPLLDEFSGGNATCFWGKPG